MRITGLLLIVSAYAGPAPHWWQKGGTMVRGVWPKCALGEGLATFGQMQGLPAFLALLDRLHTSNVSTLQMVVYDSGDGYDPDDLWCGLAGSNYSKPLSNIGSERDWHTFIDAAHERNMTVTSFWNAAYFWTGSPYFKQAEADLREYGINALPETSPARWFRWSAHKSKHSKPADHLPNTGWCDDWVWDDDANASYFSVWGCQPTTDYSSAQWRAEMIRILTRWIVDLKLDGFMFDAPDGYIGAGNDGVDNTKYSPALIRESITDVIRNVSGSRAFAFAEIYSDPPLMKDFGFDGEFADGKICPRHSGKYCPPVPRAAAIGQGILAGNASLIETAMLGPGSVDDLSAQAFRAPGLPARSPNLGNLPVTVSWLPGTSVSEDGFSSTNLNCTRGAGASYAPADLPAPVTLDECFGHCRADPHCTAIRVDWFTIPGNWTAPKIGCGLRGGINVSACRVQAPVSARSATVRYTTFAADAPIRSQLVVAAASLAGYLPVMRASGNDWGTSVAPWPGDTADIAGTAHIADAADTGTGAGGQGGSRRLGLPALLAAMRGEPALVVGALRMRVPTYNTTSSALGLPAASAPGAEAGPESHYGLLRYDALHTGRTSLVVLNLGASFATVGLDLSGFPPQLVGQHPTDLLRGNSNSRNNDDRSSSSSSSSSSSGKEPHALPTPPTLANRTSVAVSGYGYTVLAGLTLPRWAPQGPLFNCSAAYAPPTPVGGGGGVPLAACLIACLRDARCDAIEVEWVQQHAWPRPAQMAWYGNQVRCLLRGGVDLTRCARDETALASHATITVVG